MDRTMGKCRRRQGWRATTEGETLNKILNRAVLAATTAALLVLVPASTAGAALVETSPCDGAALSQPFARWNDDAFYKLVPGGDIEGSLTGWGFSGGAKVVSGSESFAATGRLGSRSLSIPAGGTVTTPAVCVNAGAPTFRYFVKSSGGLLGLLPVMNVELLYQDSVLGLVALPLGTALPNSKWNPGIQQLTLSVLPAAVANGDTPVAFRFRSTLGTWSVDDVFVDPFQRG
jgi:hypothetical protein